MEYHRTENFINNLFKSTLSQRKSEHGLASRDVSKVGLTLKNDGNNLKFNGFGKLRSFASTLKVHSTYLI